MKKTLPLLMVCFLTIAFFSCEKVEPPYKIVQQSNPTDTTDTTSNIVKYRKVLLEDYTGHRCTNCPDAHEIIQQLLAFYGDRIIPIATHVGFFANPAPPDYPSNFKTAVGEELNTYYQIESSGLPNGLINRLDFNGSPIVGHGEWGATVEPLLADSLADIYLTINNTYTEASSEVSIVVETEFIEDFSTNLNLVVYVIEDSIIAPQLYHNVRVVDYVHMHVLRKGVNGTWGDQITASATAGEKLQSNYTTTLDASWNPDHCRIVAFVFDANTNAVIQAEEESVK